MRRLALFGLVTALHAGCSCSEPEPPLSGSGGAPSEEGAGGTAPGSGGTTEMVGGESAAGASILLGPEEPLFHPPPGFEDCVHAEVKEDCQGGWCRLPPSCFVMGAPDDEWQRGRHTGKQVAAMLSHALEIQRMEMSRGEWRKIAAVMPSGYKREDDGECLEDDCPINNVTWWEAAHAANMLSEQRGLEPCYAPVNCMGELGKGLACGGVSEPGKSVYECKGYRLGTRAEAEYATKAGTYSTWYSGGITVYDNLDCNFDENLSRIGWYCFNSNDRAHARGEKDPNGFGFFDMIGNVGEWLNEQDRTTAAEGGLDPIGTVQTSVDRQVFGGLYNAAAWSACRTSDVFAATWDFRGYRIGFRLYRTLFEDSERSGPIIEE